MAREGSTETVSVEDVAGLVVVETSNTDIEFESFGNLRTFHSSSTDDEDLQNQKVYIRGHERSVEQADVPVGTPSGNFPLIPEDYLSSLMHPSEEHVSRPTSLQIQKKRHRDRLRKRELRLNVDYKKKDRAGARLRMKKRRKDPVYRSIEREKDRTRRQKARQLQKLADSKNNGNNVLENIQERDGNMQSDAI
ncbi:uncharacterized protein LOC117119392 [Anneissia japonica]|uniref:uncharacterized protein LOC117119392 n=1 Tax=Anneissia japonica TaxID=1529436 RepID=UPI00142580CE|nr:uncharacterized protein LOC117119392 [Anneissia japonica]